MKDIIILFAIIVQYGYLYLWLNYVRYVDSRALALYDFTQR